MKLLILLSLAFIHYLQCLNSKKPKEGDDIILKMTKDFYKQIGHENIDDFKSFMFKELDNSPKNSNLFSGLSPKNTTLANTESRTHSEKDLRLFAFDYSSTNRTIKLYISHSQQCSVFVNDTTSYITNNNKLNFIEHMLLHNNAEQIDPRGVYSSNININFFAFNKKMNLFSVYFDQAERNNFTVEYDYDAINLIQTKKVEKNFHSSLNTNINKQEMSFNSLIWKLLNPNIIHLKQNITIQIFFDLGKDFLYSDVGFNLPFNKTVEYEKSKPIVKYEWKGVLEPQEVVIVQVKFPMWFENCGYSNLNWVMIMIGAVFLALLVGMLYMIISTVFFEEI
jgi:hypothetical protein